MTAVIADTDILSTFGKIGQLDLLQRLFARVHIAPAVSRELGRAAQLGFTWVGSVQRAVVMLSLTADEHTAVERLSGLYPQLGHGEIESFVLAQTHHLTCLTNDRQAKAVARALGLAYLDLEELLRAAMSLNLHVWIWGVWSQSTCTRETSVWGHHTGQSRRLRESLP